MNFRSSGYLQSIYESCCVVFAGQGRGMDDNEHIVIRRDAVDTLVRSDGSVPFLLHFFTFLTAVDGTVTVGFVFGS